MVTHNDTRSTPCAWHGLHTESSVHLNGATRVCQTVQTYCVYMCVLCTMCRVVSTQEEGSSERKGFTGDVRMAKTLVCVYKPKTKNDAAVQLEAGGHHCVLLTKVGM